MDQLANQQLPIQIKNCPKCLMDFECNAADISNCACFHVPLSATEHQLISAQFSDCLCPTCLKKFKNLVA